MNVNIVLFDDFETMDAFGPVELFGKLPQHFHVRYLSVSGDLINSVHGLKIWTDFLVPEEIDGILLIPGGKGARRLLWKDERSLNIIKKAAENADYCVMIGNGSALLAQTGLLIPGGKGARRLLWKDERSLNIIKKAAENADYCVMIGNGSALLAQTGMLYHRRIADFPMDANWNRKNVYSRNRENPRGKNCD